MFEPEHSTRVEDDSSDHVAYMSLEEEEDGQDYELEDIEDVYMDDQAMRKVGPGDHKEMSSIFADQ